MGDIQTATPLGTCLICYHEHELHCDGWMAPAWAVLAQGQGERVWCSGCGGQPMDHLHAPLCVSGHHERHHEWTPEPGSFAAVYAAVLVAG